MHFNIPLFAALITNLLAQSSKVIVHYWLNRSWNWSLLYSTGGLPSSHSATVSSLTTAVGITEGVHSTSFAVSVVFSIIVMFDAAGIRRHAGQQDVVLNRLVKEFQYIFDEKQPLIRDKMLKELLGHKPVEVFAGVLLGLFVSCFLSYFF